MTGQVFGRLTVIGRGAIKCFPSGNKRQLWTCRCECGNEKDYLPGRLKDGSAKGCGCRSGKNYRKHGLYGTPIYTTWDGMKARCNNPNSISYPWYGGLGIKVCERWEKSAEAFAADMGEKPTPEHTLDRIDPSGDYEPGNCRWATRSEQMLNTKKQWRRAD